MNKVGRGRRNGLNNQGFRRIAGAETTATRRMLGGIVEAMSRSWDESPMTLRNVRKFLAGESCEEYSIMKDPHDPQYSVTDSLPPQANAQSNTPSCAPKRSHASIILCGMMGSSRGGSRWMKNADWCSRRRRSGRKEMNRVSRRVMDVLRQERERVVSENVDRRKVKVPRYRLRTLDNGA